MENRGYITITGLENKDEQPIVSVKIENGNVWMTKHELARLFGVFVQTIETPMCAPSSNPACFMTAT